MQWCARFVHDLLYITFSKKHNSWQQQQDVICLVFTNSHESERMSWAKGVPFAFYLRASECLQLGKAFDETYGTGSVRNSMSRKPAAGAVASGESRDIDVREQNKKKKHPKTQTTNHTTFSLERIALSVVQEASEGWGLQSKAGKKQGYSGQGKIYFCVLLLLLSYKAGLNCVFKKVHCFSLS